MHCLRYLKYVLRHKWFVFIECARRGLVWRGLVHDLSKFQPSEFFPYARHFYGDGKNKAAFDFAWLLHQKRNRHHWQWWVLPEYDGMKVISMGRKDVLEMFCDWKGAGRAHGTPDTRRWYETNKSKILLHEETRTLVENLVLEV